MNAKYVHRGESIDYVSGSNVAAGDVVVQGELVGVAKLDIKAGELGSLAVSGVYEMGKAVGSGSVIPVGTKVYWDAAERVAKADAEGGVNKLLGKVVKSAADADATVFVRLSQ